MFATCATGINEWRLRQYPRPARDAFGAVEAGFANPSPQTLLLLGDPAAAFPPCNCRAAD